MIKPDTLWSFLKRSEDGDELTVGRVCRSLAGHVVDPPLDAGERLMLRMIEESNEWHTEAIEKERERKKAYRESKVKAEKGQNGRAESSEMSQGQNGRAESSAYPSIHPSVHPSVRPSVHPSALPSVLPSVQISTGESVCVEAATPPPAPARTCVREDRRDVPTLAAVVNAAKSVMGVSEAYARWWYGEMEARDWTCSDGMRVSTRNWRPQLKAWWNRAKPEEREEAERALRKAAAERPRAWTAADWTLCAERCARCAGASCAAGIPEPPALNRTHPHPPENCPKYAPAPQIAPDARKRPSTRFERSGQGMTRPTHADAPDAKKSPLQTILRPAERPHGPKTAQDGPK